MLCIVYANVVGMILGLAGLLVERALPKAVPRRWLWCVILASSMAIPGYYRSHHTWSVMNALERQERQPTMGRALETSSFAVLDPGWWARSESYNGLINPLAISVSVVLLLWGIGNWWRVSRLVNRSRTSDTPGVIDGVPVIVTDSIGPATVGLWQSLVVIPRWVLALPGAERRYVLRHEEEHRRAHDASMLFATSLPLLLMPWNLAFWWLLRRLCLAVEKDCDNRVVTALGDPHSYGELLFKVAQAASHGPRLQPAFLGGAGTLERRLTELLGPPRQQAQRVIAAAAACALLALALSMPHPILWGESHTHVTMTSGAAATGHQHTQP
jgi:bla regulator protein blaR1